MNKFLLLFLLLPFTIQAQRTDSAAGRILKPDIHDKSWCISANAGFQKRFLVGIGIAKTMFVGSSHGFYGSDVYTGVNIFPAFNKRYQNVTGFKLGANVFGNAFFLGAEIQYLASKAAEDFLFTPRAGIGVSNAYIAYGYSLSSKKFPIAGISQNSLMLQINFPFYTKDKLTGKISHWNKKEKRR